MGAYLCTFLTPALAVMLGAASHFGMPSVGPAVEGKPVQASRSGFAKAILDSTWPWAFGVKSGRFTARTRLVAPPGLDTKPVLQSLVTVTFDDYGHLLRSEGTIDGKPRVAIVREGLCTIYDPEQRQMMPRARDLTMESIGVQAFPLRNLADLGNKGGLRSQGTDTILGREATEYTWDQPESTVRYWLWNSMVLRMEAAAGPMKMQWMYEVTSLDTGFHVDSRLFNVPAGLKAAG